MRSLQRIFEPIVPPEARHHAFEELRTSVAHEGTRRLMDEVAVRMGDIDGNFAREFQTQFHARLFELACFAYLDGQGFAVDRSHSRPDFLIQRSGDTIAAMEAVTSNPPSGQRTDVTAKALVEEPLDKIIEKANEEFPIRVGSALFAKLKKAYWNLHHCRGLPFVLLLGPFHEPGSGTYIDQSLARYLYGLDQSSDWIERNGIFTRQSPVREHTFNGKTIPSDFFSYPSAENVSAVVYCNQFSVSKFFRMAIGRDGPSSEWEVVRKGHYVHPDTESVNGFETAGMRNL